MMIDDDDDDDKSMHNDSSMLFLPDALTLLVLLSRNLPLMMPSPNMHDELFLLNMNECLSYTTDTNQSW